MKKWITCVFTVCLLAVALSVTAFAADGIQDANGSGNVELTPSEDKQSLTVEVSGTQSGAEYLILATSKEVTPANLDVNAVVYIDQKTGDGGSLSFTVYPKELKNGTYYVYMSSSAGSGQPLAKVGDYIATVSFIRGDADGNTKINVMDALAVVSHTTGKKTLTGTNLQAADVTDDGTVNVMDALKIVSYTLGKISEL